MPFHRSIINTLPSWAFVMMLAIFFCCMAFVFYKSVRRYYPKLLTESLSPSFGIISTFVAFLLGFTIALLWQNYQAAMRLSLDEASSFYAMIESIKNLSSEHQAKVITAVQNYLTALRDIEWPALKLGLSTSAAWEAFNNIYVTLDNFTPSAAENPAYTSIIKSLDTISTIRLNRLQTVDPLLSIDLMPVIFFGACFILFSFSSNSPANIHNHILSIVMVCILVAINISLALLITYPFSGSYGIKPKALLENIPRKYTALERENNLTLYKMLAQQAVAKTKAVEPKKVEPVKQAPAPAVTPAPIPAPAASPNPAPTKVDNTKKSKPQDNNKAKKKPTNQNAKS